MSSGRLCFRASRLSPATAAPLNSDGPGHFAALTDLFHSAPAEISSKTGLKHSEITQILGDVAFEVAARPVSLATLLPSASLKLSTGDSTLDGVLGGGILPGLVWEFAGEGFANCPGIRGEAHDRYSGSGKTQLALQLALMAQLPERLGGLSGSCCYFSLWKEAPTLRLQQLADLHPMLRTKCSLDHVHIMRVDEIPRLLHSLEGPLLALIQSHKDFMPVRLLVVDNFTSLFRSDDTDKPTTASLVDRSRDIAELSMLLHRVAAEHNIAVIAINEVVDVLDKDEPFMPPQPGQDHPVYKATAPWFSTASNVPGEDAHMPALGLAWANQVNVRVMFTKTGRRRALASPMFHAKRQRLPHETGTALHEIRQSDDSIRIRHMSVIFSCLAAPSSVDYVITEEGVSAHGEPYNAS